MSLNLRLVSRHIGALSIGNGLFMVLAMPWAVYYREYASLGHLTVSILLCLVFGGGLLLIGWRAPKKMLQREALAIVGFGLVVVAGLGALPFIVSGELGPIDAYFESMSGYTTTGSSVYTHLDAAPRSLVFWRSLTHWLGGLGIVLMLIAVLPSLGTGGKVLFLRESTGPDPRGIRPRVRETAVILFKIYIGLTILGTIGLMAAGMSLYEALNHCFAGLATGGFSTHYDSVGWFHSLPIEIVLIIIMLVGGTNFGLFFEMQRGNWSAPFKDTEFRTYICIFAVATLLITLELVGVRYSIPQVNEVERAGAVLVQSNTPGSGLPQPRVYQPFGQALRNAAFQVSTLMTDCGFVTDNSDVWPYMSRVILLVVTIMGGCVSSTAGGVKIIRVVILAKMTYWWIVRAFRPKLVPAIRVNGRVIDEDLQKRIYAFFTLYVAWMTFAWLFMSFMGLPLDSALSGVIATMNNCGPGLEFVGGYTDFNLVPPMGKVFLSLNMLVGRLEIVTILALLTPAFWRKW